MASKKPERFLTRRGCQGPLAMQTCAIEMGFWFARAADFALSENRRDIRHLCWTHARRETQLLLYGLVASIHLLPSRQTATVVRLSARKGGLTHQHCHYVRQGTWGQDHLLTVASFEPNNAPFGRWSSCRILRPEP